MAYVPLTKIPQQFFDNLGNPLVGGTLYAYLAGTSTPTNMFSDDTGTVAGTSVVLDSRGEPTTFKLIWIDSSKNYKFILKDSTGTTIWTIDDISGDDTADASMVTYTPAGSGAVQTTVQAKLRETVSVKDFGAVGDGVADDTVALQNAFAAHNQLFFPEGTYLVDAAGYPTKRAILYSTGVNNIVLSGYGATIKFKDTSTGPAGLNFIEIVNATNALIEGLTLDGNRQNQSYGYHGIAFFGGKNLTVRDVYIKNMYYDGVYVRASTVSNSDTYPEHVLMDNVVCDACGRNGTSVIGANGITIQNSIFKNTVGDPGAGIDVEPNVSDIYGVKNLIIDNCVIVQNDGRGLVITGNAPANPGETPFCINAKLTNIYAGKNSEAQDAGIGGSDISVFYAREVIIDGYSNTVGETTNPMDSGLINIGSTTERISLNNLYFRNCVFPTTSKQLVYIDSSNNDYRSVKNVYAVDCDAGIISGSKYTDISGVFGQNCTYTDSIRVGTTESSLRDVTLIGCGKVIAYNATGTGTVTIESVTIVDPIGDGIRVYGNNSTYRDITIRNSGTAAARAAWIENVTNCIFDNWKISDSGGYWATAANAYLISQTSLSGNNIRNMFPSPLGGSATWDPASIASGGSTSTTVSLLRSDIGDPCIVKHSVSLQGLMTFASTTSANTATVTLFNPTGGAIDLASHTVTVEAIK